MTIQRPLCLQELEEGVCHHGEAEPPHHRRKRSSLSATSTAWSSTSTLDGGDAIGSERRASSCLRRRAGGSSTVIIISLTTMAFELNYKRGKTMFAQKVVCAPPSSILAALSSRLPCCSVSSLLDQVIMIMRGWRMMMSVLCVFVCQCFCVWECFVL